MHPVIVTLEEGYTTTAEAGSHMWHADLPAESGGSDYGPNPEEMTLGALGSCMSQTAMLYANRKGWQVDEIQVQLTFERFRGDEYADYNGEAAFVHEVREHITIKGDLTPEQERRVREIMTKCPIRRLLANPVFFVEGQTVTI